MLRIGFNAIAKRFPFECTVGGAWRFVVVTVDGGAQNEKQRLCWHRFLINLQSPSTLQRIIEKADRIEWERSFDRI